MSDHEHTYGPPVAVPVAPGDTTVQRMCTVHGCRAMVLGYDGREIHTEAPEPTRDISWVTHVLACPTCGEGVEPTEESLWGIADAATKHMDDRHPEWRTDAEDAP